MWAGIALMRINADRPRLIWIKVDTREPIMMKKTETRGLNRPKACRIWTPSGGAFEEKGANHETETDIAGRSLAYGCTQCGH